MNYRHAFHAGNFADVLKHAIVAQMCAILARKPKPYAILDTHGGAGVYDLALDDRAARTGEWTDGIGRILDDPAPHVALRPWLEAVDAMNAGQPEMRFYPGSPVLCQSLMRADDRLIACDLHPEEAALLEQALMADPRTRVEARDGYGAIKALLPMTIRRGFVLIDPPFERPGEFDRMLRGLEDGLKRWATGSFALWRPIKHGDGSADFLRALEDRSGAPTLDAALYVKPSRAEGLVGTGMTIVNPPYGLFETLADLGPWLTPRLAQRGAGEWRLRWITPQS